MKIVSFLLRYSRGLVVLAIVASAVSGVSNAGLIAVINSAVSRSPFPIPVLMLGFIALCVLLPVSRFISQFLLTHLAQKAVFDMRMRMSRQILSAPLRQLEEIGAPRLLATLTEDVMMVTNALVNLPLVCMHAAILVGCLVYLGWLSFTLLCGVLAFMVLAIGTFQLVVMAGTQYMRVAREEQDGLFNHFRAMTEGTKELKLNYGRRDDFLNKLLRNTAAAYRRYVMKGNNIYMASGSLMQFLHFFIIGLVLFALPMVENVEPQTLSGYAIILLYMIVPLDALLSMFPLLGRANVSLNKIESLGLTLAASAREEESTIPVELEPAWHRLELSGVTHTYYREREDDRFVLGPVDLTLTPGELVFVVGGNGSGKTTLVKLLTGLYVPEGGEIRLDGHAINNENREYYRQFFSVVFSDFFLFESLLGIRAPDLDDHARQYLEQLLLDRKVEVREGKLSTTHLSQGQRKRLALLTAYLEDRPIYVFDEWAADQDPQFKEIFYHQLLPELRAKGKTVIVISHDDQYYHVADRMIKLNYGKVEYDKQLAGAQAPAGLPA